MQALFKKHRSLWPQKSFILAALAGCFLLLAGVGVGYLANSYTVAHASNSVTDIILDNIPVVNVDFFYAGGASIFIVFLAFLLLYEPRRIPFVLKAVGLFFLIRSGFVILTHIAPPSGAYFDPTDLIYKISSGDDLFFSGHTGLPFLLAFIFYDERRLRYVFFAATAIGAVTVLLGHLHYSIDVFSALFISFGVFHLAKNIFHKDFTLATQQEQAA